MPGNAPNRLDVLPTLMLSSLPKDASPHLKDPWEAVALFGHASMLSVKFRLVGLGEDQQIPASSSDGEDKPLPAEWNRSTGSVYAFRYKHDQSALEFLIKVSRLGKKAVINALAIDDDKVQTFDVAVADFLSPSSFPYTAPPTASSESTGDYSTSDLKSIVDLFISPGRLSDLWALFKINVVQKLAPGLGKTSTETEEDPDDTDAQRQAQDETRTHPPGRSTQPPQQPRHDPLRDDRLPPAAYPRPFPAGGDPLAPEQARPRPHGDLQPPGWDDEYDILRAPGRGGFGGIGGGGVGGGVGGYRPPNLGERDLYPQGLGPNDPFRPSGPMGLGRIGGGGGGGGMHPTHDDFFGGDEGEGLDPLRAPRGARYDPPFPGMGPPRGSGGGGGFGGPGGFGGGGGFGGFGGGGII